MCASTPAHRRAALRCPDDVSGPVPAGRTRRDRDRCVVRSRRGLRPGSGRGRRRRGARRPTGGPARGDGETGGVQRTPSGGGRDRRHRSGGVHGPRAGGCGRVREGRRPGEQRRARHGRAGDARDARPVPVGHRRQPQRLLLDGPGVWPGDAAGFLDHQRLLGAGIHHRRPAPGGVRLVEGGPHRSDPRPRGAVDGPQGHPGQRRRPGLLHLRDDRPVPRRLPRPDPRPRSRRAEEETRPSWRPRWSSSLPTRRGTSRVRRSSSTAA